MDEFDFNWTRGRDYIEVTLPANSKEQNLFWRMFGEGVTGVKLTASNKDGSIVGHVPLSCVLFRRPPAKREMTPERLAAANAAIALAHEARKTARNAADDNLPAEAPKGEI